MFINVETGANETQLFNLANIERIVHEHTSGCVTIFFISGHSHPLRGAGAASLIEQLELVDDVDDELDDNADEDEDDDDR